MDQLPRELIDLLCSYLPLPSLRMFRRTCKTYALIGEEHLFQDFEFRVYPSHHRLYQLEKLSVHPTIAPRLKCLTYESGVQLEYAVYRYWQENVYQDISKAWSRNVAAKGSSLHEKDAFHTALQARFTSDMPERYDLYRWHLDQQAAMMAKPAVRDRLVRIMNSLGVNHDIKLKLVMAEPKISLDALEKFDAKAYAYESPQDPDPRRRVENRRRNCLLHYLNFLEAANLSRCDFTDLNAVYIPYQILILTADLVHGPEVLDKMFRGLVDVDIKLSRFPHSDWLERAGVHEEYFGGHNVGAKNLARLLNLSSKMESLSLEFPEGHEMEYSFRLFDRTHIDRFPRLWLPHLTQLSLRRFRCKWADLHALLEAAKNVKALSLRDCMLKTGSMVDLIMYLPSMKLESVCLEGKWSVDADEGIWHSHNRADFTSCLVATSYEGPYAVDGLRSKVESYILNGGECPLPRKVTGGHQEEIWEMSGDTSWHFLPEPRWDAAAF